MPDTATAPMAADTGALPVSGMEVVPPGTPGWNAGEMRPTTGMSEDYSSVPESQRPIVSAAAAPQFTPEDIPNLANDPRLKDLPPAEQEAKFDYVVRNVTPQILNDPNVTPEHVQAYNQMVDANRAKIGPSIVQQAAALPGEMAQGLGNMGKDMAAAAVAAPNASPQGVEARKTLAASAGYHIANTIHSVYRFINRHHPGTAAHNLDGEVANLMDQVDKVKYPMGAEHTAKWVKSASDQISKLQEAANVDSKKHGLTTADNAKRLAYYMHTRNPKARDELMHDLTGTRTDSALEVAHQKLLESPGAKQMDAMYPGAGEHLVSGGDPALYLPAGRALKVMKGAGRVAKAAKFLGEQGAYGAFNAIRANSGVSAGEIGHEALKAILMGGVLHGASAAVRKVIGGKQEASAGSKSPEKEGETIQGPTAEPEPPTPAQLISRQSPDYADAQAAFDKTPEAVAPETVSKFGLDKSKELPPSPGDRTTHEDIDSRAAAAGFEMPESEKWTKAQVVAQAAEKMTDPDYAARMVQFYKDNPDVRIGPVSRVVVTQYIDRLGDSFEHQRKELEQMPPTAQGRVAAVARFKETEDHYQDTLATIRKANSEAGTELGAIRIARAEEQLESLPMTLANLRAKGELSPKTRAKVTKDFEDQKAKREVSEKSDATAKANKKKEAEAKELPPVAEAVKSNSKTVKKAESRDVNAAAKAARERLKTGGIQISSASSGEGPQVSPANFAKAKEILSKTRIGKLLLRRIQIMPDWERAIHLRDFSPDEMKLLKTAEGFHDPQTGKSVVIRDNIRPRDGEAPEQAVIRVITHELEGHERNNWMRAHDPKYNREWLKLAGKIPQAELDNLQTRYPHLKGNPDALALEWYAQQAERLGQGELPSPTSLLGQLWQAIKDFLNRLAGKETATDQMVRDLIVSGRAVPESLEGMGGQDGEVEIQHSDRESLSKIYRAGDADEQGVKAFSSWSEDRGTAEAYQDNPGFGGETLREEQYPLNKVLDADTTNRRGMGDLAEELGFPREDGSEWFDNGWRYPWEESSKVRGALKKSGYDAIRYPDDFPEGAITVVPLKDRGRKEIQEIQHSGSVSERDHAYLEAVAKGDTDTAQRMVDEAARANSGEGADFRGEHGAPDDRDASAADLTENGVYPKDVYTHPHYYEQNEGLSELYKIQRLRGNPDAPVWIWRAIPKSVYKAALKSKGTPLDKMVRAGDWVSTSKKYAQDHGEGALNGDFKVVGKRVRARDIFTNGDSIFEWGYHPKLKSVIHDSNGRIIPLSERFNPHSNSIAYSLPEKSSALDDLGIIAASHIANGVKDVGAKLVEEFGDTVKPHLTAILDRGNQILGQYRAESKGRALSAIDKVKAKLASEPPTELHSAAAALAKAHAYADASLTGDAPQHTETLISRVQADLASAGHDLTPSETARAITNYGEQPEPKLNPAQKRLRELKAQILVNEKKADALDNKVPFIRKIFSKPSDVMRRKTAELQDLVRKIENEEVQAGRMKTAQQKREAQLENQIADIQKQIDTPGHKGREGRKPLPETTRSKELTTRRNSLQAHLYDLRKDAVAEEQNQKRVAVLQNRLNNLLGMLESGERPEVKKSTDTPEITALKDDIAAVQSLIRGTDKSLERTPTEEEAYNKRRIAAAEASEKYWKDRLAKKQLRPDLPVTHPLNQEAQDAISKAKAARQAFDDDAEIEGMRARKRLEGAIHSLNARLKKVADDVSRMPKEPNFNANNPVYRALKNELVRLQTIKSNKRLQEGRDPVSAAKGFNAVMDEQIAKLERITAEARRKGKSLAPQESELARLREERRQSDVPALERFKALQIGRTARANRRTAEVERTGQPPVKKSKRQIELDATARSDAAIAKRAEEKFQATVKEAEYKMLPWWARGLRRTADLFREAAISGYHTAAKLSGFAALRQVDGAAKEIAGLFVSRLPYFKELMRDARFESAGETLGADAKARAQYMLTNVKTMFGRGLKEAGQQIWTGHHDTASLYDKPRTEPHGIESRILSRIGGGSLHAAIKAPVIIGSHEGNLARLQSLGITAPPEESYAYAKRQALQENNRFSNWVKQGMSSLESPDPKTGQVSASKAVMAAFIKMFLTKDVVKVPSNWISQIWEGLSGLPRSVKRTRSAFGRGLENVSPQEKEITSRLAKVGIVGGTMLLWGFLDSFRRPEKRVFGGFYEPGKRDDKDPAFGAIRLWGTSNSHWWAIMTHNPFAAIGQIGNTIGRVYQEAIRKHDSKAEAVAEGVIKSALGMMESSPVGGSIMHLSQHHDTKSLAGDELRSLIPASVSNFAEDQDPAKGRQRKSIGDEVKYGIPNLGLPFIPNRQQLPVKRAR